MTIVEGITTLITTMFDVFMDVCSNFAGGINEGLTRLLFEVGTDGAITAVSTSGYVTFALIGLSLGLSLFYLILRIARIGNN